MSGSLEHSSWDEMSNLVKSLNPTLFEIIDDINPAGFPVDIAKYPFGTTISDPKHYYLPSKNGGLEAKPGNEFPYMLVVDKSMETFLETPEKIIPGTIYEPGSFFPYNHEVNYRGLTTRPTCAFNLTSGLRNIMITPLYAENSAFLKMAKAYNLDRRLSPQNPTHHHEILKAIAQHEQINWSNTLLLFGKKWKDNIQNNPKWARLKIYILEQSISINAVRRNFPWLNYAMHDISRDRRLNVKDYTFEIMQQLFFMAIGSMPGFCPSTNNHGLPTDGLIKYFNEIYIPPTTPIIIEPALYDHTKTQLPIYHSLCVTNDSLNDKKSFRPLSYLNEISLYIDTYLEGLSEHIFTRDTIFGRLSKQLNKNFYSERGHKAGGIKECSQVMNDDIRFMDAFKKYKEKTTYGFSKRSIFTKALISISLKESELN